MLPKFTLDGYAELLLRLKALGYALHPTSEINSVKERAVFLRHDVDLHLEGALDVAAVEESLGVRSTWYVGTRLAYNPAYAPNAEVVRTLASHGHGIGLHYVADSRDTDDDIAFLESLAMARVHTWVMHEPSSGAPDPFMARSALGTGNPHLPSYGLHYVSDSGMRWRDPWISELLVGTHERVMLNTHHEHWVGPDTDRAAQAAWIWALGFGDLTDYYAHLLGGYDNAPS